ncbi:gp005 [Rhodococcus phage ReqiDocB7]|uniref:gp005 n=1 Tax=Rhodococcus phage ReqiDocB7 TaxID=691966 RepID=UPI0001CDEA8E|nr:gp005 [Rhodococcus phage ReqiDocB7]ADD80791.1 gp005 [Rhodococcus phage ReqiDocB7]
MADYQKIYLRITGTIGDTPEDADPFPDRVMATGSAFIKPNIRDGYAENAVGPDGIDELNLPSPITCTITDGMVTYNGEPFVWLLVSNEKWNWNISFPQLRINGVTKKLDSFNFDLEPATTAQKADPNYPGINLAPLIEFPNPETGQKSVRGPRGWGIETIELVGDDQFRFTLDDPLHTVLPLVTVPALTINQETLDAAAAAVYGAELSYQNKLASDAARDLSFTYRNAAEGFKNTASTQATTATTKAGEATTARNEALGFRNEAEGFKNTAGTSASNAATSASEALGYRNTAGTHASNASTSASNASDSATTAGNHAASALTYRNQAEGFKNTAEQAVLGVVPDNSIATAKLQNLAVTAAKIANATITGTQIAGNAISSSHIVDGTITNADISATAGIAKTKLETGVQTSLGLADNAPQMYAGLTKITEWYGTQAAYDLLPSGTKTAAGFRAAIY